MRFLEHFWVNHLHETDLSCTGISECKKGKGGGCTVGMPDFSSVIRESRMREHKKEFDQEERTLVCLCFSYFFRSAVARNLSRSV